MVTTVKSGWNACTLPGDFGEAQLIQLAVDDLNSMSSLFEQRFRITVLQRQMWFAAAEVDAAIEGPGRINEREQHSDLPSRALARRRRGLPAATHVDALPLHER